MNSFPSEIEKKFFLAHPPTVIGSLSPILIQQGYLAIEEKGNEVRVRKKEDTYLMTIKSSGGLQRSEVEFPITQEHFDQLWPLTIGRRIRKKRFLHDYQGHQIELDQYLDHMEGLWTAEVEFTTLEEAIQFIPPPWMETEITANPHFKNRYLATLTETPNFQDLL